MTHHARDVMPQLLFALPEVQSSLKQPACCSGGNRLVPKAAHSLSIPPSAGGAAAALSRLVTATGSLPQPHCTGEAFFLAGLVAAAACRQQRRTYRQSLTVARRRRRRTHRQSTATTSAVQLQGDLQEQLRAAVRQLAKQKQRPLIPCESLDRNALAEEVQACLQRYEDLERENSKTPGKWPSPVRLGGKVECNVMQGGLSVTVREELERLEMLVDEESGRSTFFVADYSMCAGSSEAGVEDTMMWKDLKKKAWLLKQSGDFLMDDVAVRIYYLGGSQASCEGMVLNTDHLDRVGRDFNADWQPTQDPSKEAQHVEETVKSAVAAALKPIQDPSKEAKHGEETVKSAVAAASNEEEGTTIVNTPEEAKRVLDILMSEKLRSPDRYHAIDVETRNWEPGMQMYGVGEVICWSVYCGSDIDFGNGPRLWINNFDPKDGGGLLGLVEYFKTYLEDDRIQKVFHNYSFDRAMLLNHGCRVRGLAGDTMHMARLENSERDSYSLEALGKACLGSSWQKQKLKNLMGQAKVKRPEELHMSNDEAVRKTWIDYSAFDTAVTWKLHQYLNRRLGNVTLDIQGAADSPESTMLDFYKKYWCPLADVLVNIEERGVPLDQEYLRQQLVAAEEDMEVEKDAFRDFVRKQWEKFYPNDDELAEGLKKFNPNSTVQMKHLLYGKGKALVANVSVGGLGLPVPSKVKSMTGHDALAQLCGPGPESSKSACGTAVDIIGQEGCIGLHHKVKLAQLSKQVTGFLRPLSLPETVDSDSRLHTLLNIQTQTGRLTSSNPNLQQLPAVEKDPYQIRRAVRCSPGKSFIIADYGQLDLRTLAHATGCEKLRDALSGGGDIHSATALNMYENIQKAVSSGEVSLDGSGGKPSVKDMFPSERRHAKTVNFGIAYGLTEKGLANQLDCTTEEAADMITKWFDAYPGVQAWKKQLVRKAIDDGLESSLLPYVSTFRGRRRHIRDLYECSRKDNPKRRKYVSKMNDRDFRYLAAERQAINSPVQGGSADIVVEAMLKADRDEELRKLGYVMILQVHDELIFEGPEEHEQQALKAVKRVMEHPFLDDLKFKVELPVDAKVAKTWHEMKGA